MAYITTWTCGIGLNSKSATDMSVLQRSEGISHMLCGAARRLRVMGANSWSPSTCGQRAHAGREATQQRDVTQRSVTEVRTWVQHIATRSNLYSVV
jgi:hypothetical protein